MLSLFLSLIVFLAFGVDVVRSARSTCHDVLVRKEWRSLSRIEREDFADAVKCLANRRNEGNFRQIVYPNDIAPYNTTSSIYDDFSYSHMDLNHVIHMTGLFLPWHRWFLHTFESKLRHTCHYSGALPYWDWTQDAHDFHSSPFFQDSDPKSGLGGFGRPEHQFRVVDGAFSATSSFAVSYPIPHTLRRNYSSTADMAMVFSMPGFVWNKTRATNESFTARVVQSLVDGFIGDYKGFQTALDGSEGPHLNVHFAVGGDVAGACPVEAPPGCIPGPTFAPNDPLFFLHHASIDRIWYKWQKKHKANERAFFGGTVQPLQSVAMYMLYSNGAPPMMTTATMIPTNNLTAPRKIDNMFDTENEHLCYVYE
ncbi:Di-copper centre-containing protein [Mycena kentingensis (nom. inval.)]|nr:Di-copper centre-containing protein [Mycena kentingensis (nom. inval.)]